MPIKRERNKAKKERSIKKLLSILLPFAMLSVPIKLNCPEEP